MNSVVMLPEPLLVTWDLHDASKGRGDSYYLIGLQVYEDRSLNPILIDNRDGRLLVTNLYNIQVDLQVLSKKTGIPIQLPKQGA
jgi:hypothetical protein